MDGVRTHTFGMFLECRMLRVTDWMRRMREEDIKSEKERMAPEILIYYIFTSGNKFAGWCVVGHVVATGKSRAPAGSGPSCNPQG